MLILSKKNKGVNIIDCWYADGELKQPGVIRYQEALSPIGNRSTEFQTLFTDLTESEEDILQHFTKNCRYEIRRAPKEGVTCKVLIGRDLCEEDMELFADFFEGFWESKGVSYNEKDKLKAMMKQYAGAEAFAITKACIEDKLLVYHTYVVEEKRARLYQSASQFRTDESISSNVIGYANRYLHYQDMLFFKNMGKEIYDWGGAGTQEEVLSITKFKEAFGGAPVTLYNGECVNGAMAKLYKKMISLVEKL